ncbi:MAG: gamma-glutamyltransferase [Clostridia bacterium]|nr:gamma-glutamyltransferase [Clostridia bacterium]
MKKALAIILVIAMIMAYFPATLAASGFTANQVLDAAQATKLYVEQNGKLPESVKIASEDVEMPMFFGVLLKTTLALNESGDLSQSIVGENCGEASNPQDKVKSVNIDKDKYLEMAQNGITFVSENGRCPNFLTVVSGTRISYNNAIYVYSSILTYYKTYEALPDSIDVVSWKELTGDDTGNSVSTPKPTATLKPTAEPLGKSYKKSDIATAAIAIERTLKSTKEFPETVMVAGDSIQFAQYMYIASMAISYYNSGTDSEIPLKDIATAPSPTQTETSATITKDEYLVLAEKAVTYSDSNSRMPNYFTSEIGSVGYQSFALAIVTILASCAKNGALPESINLIPWHVFATMGGSAVTAEPVKVNFEAVRRIAERVAVATRRQSELPISVSVFGVKVYMSSLLSLFTDTVAGLQSEKEEFEIKNILPVVKGNESLKEGALSKNEYLILAKDIQEYILFEDEAPQSMLCSLGMMSFENLVYTYASLLSGADADGELADSITVKTWENITGEKLQTPSTVPVYTPVPEFLPEKVQTQSSTRIKTVAYNDVAQAAKRLVSRIKYSKTLPKTVAVSGETISIPEFLLLMMNTVSYINGNILSRVQRVWADSPEGDGENIANGVTITKEEYAQKTKEAVAYTKSTGLAPSYIITAKGTMGFKTSLYFYAKVLSSFLDEEKLPDSVTVETWESLTGMKLPAPMITLSPVPTPVPTPYNGPGVMEGDLYGTSGVGTNGGVASASKYASKIGVDILKAGGNAIDAAVATIFAVGLCEPSGSSLGGGGITVIYLAEEDKYITMDYMVGGTGKGGAGIPGIPLGAVTMLEKYGTMTLQEILKPVIKLANEGFAVTNTFCKKSKLVADKKDEYIRTLFRNSEGEYFSEGDIFKNEDLGKVLQAISDNGISYFYDSEFTDELCAYMQSRGLTMTRELFASYEVIEGEPRVGEYRGHTIYAGSGTATGGASVLSMLKKMDDYDLELLGHDHPETVRITATSFGIRPASSLNTKVLSLEELTEDVDWFDTKSTTMLVTRDEWGNMVASNNTLGANFGSEIAMPGTGFCISSRNCAVGDRVSSTMAPCIVAHADGTPMLGVGSPGNSAIITATAITISNMLDFDMTVAEAIHAPRLYGSGSTITIEARYSPWVLEELKAMRFNLYDKDEFSDGVGCVSAIHVDEYGKVYASADIRREYMAYAY